MRNKLIPIGIVFFDIIDERMGKKVLIVEDDGATATPFNIRFKGKWVVTSLPAGGVATYVVD